MAASQEDKKAYLDHYKRLGKKAQPFGMWMRQKKKPGSRQMRLQRLSLGRKDTEALEQQETTAKKPLKRKVAASTKRFKRKLK